MILAIHQLERRRPLNRREIVAFLDAHQWPLVEGLHVTFVWRGEADEVHLRHWVYGLASEQPFKRIADTDLWYLVLDLPKRSRFEYKFDVVRGGKNTWIRDPLNARLAHDPFGEIGRAHV